jgi:hypothetical protein
MKSIIVVPETETYLLTSQAVAEGDYLIVDKDNPGYVMIGSKEPIAKALHDAEAYEVVEVDLL